MSFFWVCFLNFLFKTFTLWNTKKLIGKFIKQMHDLMNGCKMNIYWVITQVKPLTFPFQSQSSPMVTTNLTFMYSFHCFLILIYYLIIHSNNIFLSFFELVIHEITQYIFCCRWLFFPLKIWSKLKYLEKLKTFPLKYVRVNWQHNVSSVWNSLVCISYKQKRPLA